MKVQRVRIEAAGERGWVTYFEAERRLVVDHPDAEVRAAIRQHYEKPKEFCDPQPELPGVLDNFDRVLARGTDDADRFSRRTCELEAAFVLDELAVKVLHDDESEF